MHTNTQHFPFPIGHEIKQEPLHSRATLALTAFLEPFVMGKRVAIIGDLDEQIHCELKDRGARFVQIFRQGLKQVWNGPTQTRSVQPPFLNLGTSENEFGVRDGAFDFVFVPDLQKLQNPFERVAQIRRLVSPTGVVVFMIRNSKIQNNFVQKPFVRSHPTTNHPTSRTHHEGPLGYYQFFDIVSLHFPIVKMLGQSTFSGFTVAEFTAIEQSDVSIDTSFKEESTNPDWFISVASQIPVAFDPFTVIEMPYLESFVPDSTSQKFKTEKNVEHQDVQHLHDQLTSIKQNYESKLEETKKELTLAAEKIEDSKSKQSNDFVRAERLSCEVRDLNEELRQQRERAAKLAKQLDDEKKLKTKLELELGMLRGNSEYSADKTSIGQLKIALQGSEENVQSLEKELFSLKVLLDQEEAISNTLKERLESLEKQKVEVFPSVDARLQDLQKEIEKLEQRLLDRGQKISSLEDELSQAKRVGRELILQLEGNGSNESNPSNSTSVQDEQTTRRMLEMEGKCKELMSILSKKEADAQAFEWKISHLESLLQIANQSKGKVSQVLQSASTYNSKV